MKAAFHVARTGRCGPVLVDVPRDLQEATLDFAYPDDVDLPGWRPPSKVHPLQIREAARAIAHARKPVLYVGGGTLNGDACAELLRARRGRHAPGRHDADGQERVPGDARAPLRLAGHARGEVVEHRDEHVRRPRRDRRALRRPRDGQALGVRARSDRRPPRHRPGGDLEAARRGHPRRRAARRRPSASSRTRSRSSAPRARPRPDAWLEQIRALARGVPAPLRHERASGSSRSRSCRRSRRSPPATDMIVTTGVGQHQMWAMQYVVSERPRSFITSGGLGTMGYGIPAAIGAKAARPEATVVCVDGDGCFQMTAQELDDRGARGPADRRRARQQRLPRDGHAVAGHVLRRPPLARPPDVAGAGLRQARRGLRRRRDGRRRARASSSRRSRRRSRSGGRSSSTAASTRPSSASR